MLSCQEILTDKKGGGHTKMLISFHFLHIYKLILFGTESHYTILSNYVMIFKVDAQMSKIFIDFQGKNSRKIPPIDFNRSEITDIVISI